MRVVKEGGVNQMSWLDQRPRSWFTFEIFLSLVGGKKLYESCSAESEKTLQIYTCIDSFTVYSLHVIAMIISTYTKCGDMENPSWNSRGLFSSP